MVEQRLLQDENSGPFRYQHQATTIVAPREKKMANGTWHVKKGEQLIQANPAVYQRALIRPFTSGHQQRVDKPAWTSTPWRALYLWKDASTRSEVGSKTGDRITSMKCPSTALPRRAAGKDES